MGQVESISSRDLGSSLKDETLGRALSWTVPEVLVEREEEKGEGCGRLALHSTWAVAFPWATMRAERRELKPGVVLISTKAAGSLMYPALSEAWLLSLSSKERLGWVGPSFLSSRMSILSGYGWVCPESAGPVPWRSSLLLSWGGSLPLLTSPMCPVSPSCQLAILSVVPSASWLAQEVSAGQSGTVSSYRRPPLIVREV